MIFHQVMPWVVTHPNNKDEQVGPDAYRAPDLQIGQDPEQSPGSHDHRPPA